MFDLVALGESLIDFTPSGKNELGMNLFACNPGGAPANVLAMYSKLGGKTAFIGKVGQDSFGDFLERTMSDAGICIDGLLREKEIPTTLAFVQLNENGDRSFSFYRKPGADICLKKEELPVDILKNCRVFHFGSVSLTDEPVRSATLTAAKIAKESGAIISYDPNYRPLLWDNAETAKKEILKALPLADIVKVSLEEMELLTDRTDLSGGADELLRYGASLVLITMGADGAYYKTSTSSAKLQTYDVKTVDTTGAGDTFLGALLYCLKGKTLESINRITKEEWIKIIDFSNAAGSLTTTKKGAIPAMPDLQQIMKCVNKYKC